jgi:integrase
VAGKPKHRGFGHIRKLPSGRHQASYVGPDLARHAAPKTFDTKQDAEGWLSKEHSLIATETWLPPARRAALAARPSTFGDYAEAWLLERDLKPRTRNHYRSLLDTRILPALGSVPIQDISPLTVRTWHAGMPNDKPTIRAHAYSLFRAIMATATADEVIASNPCHLRGAGTAKRVTQTRPASLVELAQIVTAMPAKYRLAVLLSAWCALRFGELTELRRRDVDLTDGKLRVRRAVAWVESQPQIGKPKSDAGVRDVAIPPHLMPLIKGHLKDHAHWGADGLLFPSPQGKHLTTSTLYASYWPARKKAGRPDLRWHDLRHTGAVLAAATGATLAELMARLGHSTPGAAMRYQHAAEGRDAVIAARLSELAMDATT